MCVIAVSFLLLSHSHTVDSKYLGNDLIFCFIFAPITLLRGCVLCFGNESWHIGTS